MRKQNIKMMMTLISITSVLFPVNSVTACKKAENPFEKRIPHFRLDTENFGERDFYDCTELHKANPIKILKINMFKFKILNYLDDWSRSLHRN